MTRPAWRIILDDLAGRWRSHRWRVLTGWHDGTRRALQAEASAAARARLAMPPVRGVQEYVGEAQTLARIRSRWAREERAAELTRANERVLPWPGRR